MGNPLISREIDAAVSAALLRALEESEASLRALSRESGVKLTRLGDVLKRGKPMTVGELVRIARALGLLPWQVMRDAEEAVAALQADLLDVVTGGGVDEADVIPLRPLQAELPPVTIPRRDASSDELALPAAAKTSVTIKRKTKRNAEESEAD